MSPVRHKTAAAMRSKRILIAAPLAVVATLSAVSAGVVLTGDDASPQMAASAIDAATANPTGEERRETVSRSSPDRTDVGVLQAVEGVEDAAAEVSEAESRRLRIEARAEAAATRKAVSNASDKLWTTGTLNLWNDSDADAQQVGEIDEGEKVLVTGRNRDARDEIVVKGKSRWVTAGYLSDEKPLALGGSCSNGSSVASGVSSNIVKVHNAVCANFPEISTYGTLRGGGGDHGTGRAVDIMISGERGWQVARFVRENAAALGVKYVIYSQSIWSTERGGEGWRGMSSRGSATANHYDHVHVSTY